MPCQGMPMSLTLAYRYISDPVLETGFRGREGVRSVGEMASEVMRLLGQEHCCKCYPRVEMAEEMHGASTSQCSLES